MAVGSWTGPAHTKQCGHQPGLGSGVGAREGARRARAAGQSPGGRSSAWGPSLRTCWRMVTWAVGGAGGSIFFHSLPWPACQRFSAPPPQAALSKSAARKGNFLSSDSSLILTVIWSKQLERREKNRAFVYENGVFLGCPVGRFLPAPCSISEAGAAIYWKASEGGSFFHSSQSQPPFLQPRLLEVLLAVV